MATQESILGRLLNDESFLRWLKGHATPKDQEKWGRWLLENPRHRNIVEKARKILTMPFKTIQSKDKTEELYRLQKKLSEQNKNSGATKKEE